MGQRCLDLNLWKRLVVFNFTEILLLYCVNRQDGEGEGGWSIRPRSDTL